MRSTDHRRDADRFLNAALAALEAWLRAVLARPLPGLAAQLAAAPLPRPDAWRPGHFPRDAKQAAGLLLLYPVDDLPHLVLTVRSAVLPHHPGQVSLPGGALDEGETVERAALREAHEEVGIDPAQVRLLGCLTPVHVVISGFVLHPVIGLCERRPAFRNAAHEVARILEVPLDALLGPSRLRRERRWYQGREYDVPYFDLCGEKVWGATAMVLAELATLLAAR